MTFQETLNQFLILGAALCKHVPTNDLKASQQQVVKDEILYNVEFATQMKNLFKNNFVFEGEQGCVPTRKGWDTIRPQVKVVEKPFNRTRVPQEQLVPMTVTLMQEVCYRHKNHPKFAPYIKEQIMELGEAYNCINEVISDVVSSLNQTEVETPIEEVKVITKAKKVKTGKKVVEDAVANFYDTSAVQC